MLLWHILSAFRKNNSFKFWENNSYGADFFFFFFYVQLKLPIKKLMYVYLLRIWCNSLRCNDREEMMICDDAFKFTQCNVIIVSVCKKNNMYYIYATQRIRKTCYFCITIWDYVYSVYFHSHCLFCDPFYAQLIFLIYDAIK